MARYNREGFYTTFLRQFGIYLHSVLFFKKAQNAFARLIPFEKHTHADKSEIERERSYDYIFYLQSLESHDKQAQFLTR